MATCGECKNFIRVDNTTRGKCRLRKYLLSRQKKETNREFMPYASRAACKQFYVEGTTITNYDRIKNMTVDELAQTINDKTYGCMFRFGCPCNCGDNYPENCVDKIKEWLESEVDE